MRNAPAELQSSHNAWPQDRTAGVCLHLTSLPGKYGIGEIGGAARRFVDFMVEAKLSVWQFLPTGPTGFGDSPYQSLSSYAGNEMLIDIAELLNDGLVTRSEVESLTRFSPDKVDFSVLIPQKSAVVRSAAHRFASSADAKSRAEFDKFVVMHDKNWLHDYALFRVLKARHRQKSWVDWEKPYRHRDARSLIRLADRSRGDLDIVKISQFLFCRQWQRLREYAHEQCVTLLGDMPIYVALDSSDAWTSVDHLCVDERGVPRSVAGVPPDYFSESGQLWGNPLYNWRKHHAENFAWWVKRLRHAITQADLLRIDHFRGFESYWAISYGAQDARQGEWKSGPGDKLFRELRNQLGSLPIVAEDLGEITPSVESLRKRHGIPGMRVLQFEVGDREFDIGRIPRQCVCYTGTHDNDTTIGWFASGGNLAHANYNSEFRQTVMDKCGCDARTIHKGMIGLAYSSAALVAIAPLQDYLGLGSESRLNTPGTAEHNWRWRVQENALDAKLLQEIGEMVESSGRSKAN